jgi:hypothetical protein
MTTPSGTPSKTIKFSDLALEYTGNSSNKISISQLGYGGQYNEKNSCTDLARNDVTIPLHSNVVNIPAYNGPNSNIKISSFYSKNVYAAPPDGAITINTSQTNYNFSSLLEIGRNYNPNQNKRSNPLFQHITNTAVIYATTPANWAGIIPSSPNAIVYLKNNGGIYGCGGKGGNGGSNNTAKQDGGTAGPALLSEIYTILDNNQGLIYGGGNGGGGGSSGNRSWNDCYGCGESNAGGGGGGGGGGQSYQATSGGTGGDGHGGGGKGGDGGGGNIDGAGAKGGGGGGGSGDAGSDGTGGSAWGSADSFIGASGGKIISGGTQLKGYATFTTPASSLSAPPELSGTYGNGGSEYSCNECGNPVSEFTWYNYSPTTVLYYGSGLVVNVTRYPTRSSGPDGVDASCGKYGCYYYNCGYCTYYWSYAVSIVSGGSGYIPARSLIQINVDGNAFNLIVY